MEAYYNVVLHGAVLGVTATGLFDLWIIRQKLMGRRTLNFAYLGRWIGNFRYFKFAHNNIANAPEISQEFIIGLLGHYAIGILIAELLLVSFGDTWFINPNIQAALIVGAATAVFPLLIMQPAMGGGIAFTRTPTPMKNSLNSLFNHLIFGFCLFIAAKLIQVMN